MPIVYAIDGTLDNAQLTPLNKNCDNSDTLETCFMFDVFVVNEDWTWTYVKTRTNEGLFYMAIK